MKLSVPNGINMDAHVGWCPGCGHGIVVRLVAEAARDLGIEENIIMVEDVACGEFAQNVLKFNTIGAAHGRPIITAAGAKRTPAPTRSSSRTRATVPPTALAWRAPFTARCVMRTSWRSSSTTAFSV